MAPWVCKGEALHLRRGQEAWRRLQEEGGRFAHTLAADVVWFWARSAP